MKIKFFCLLSLIILFLSFSCSKPLKKTQKKHTISNNNLLHVQFADSKWKGKKIPKNQQCLKYGGINPKSPSYKLINIPKNTDAIIMSYSDDSFEIMKDGGHGIVGYKIKKGTKSVIIPSITAHSKIVPEEFFIVFASHSSGWDKDGAYLPPCSGGLGNVYSVTIKAVKIKNFKENDFKILAQKKLQLCIY